ncbi:MAG: NADP-dependent isocitrate dehydrogenase [Parachlamydiaceae bacterium]|nr:NADP-dependent isocitrate dehydrogenase [Parachlamydiaceae bacterium]
MTNKKIPITVAEGDGIGPEIMAATLHILKESGAQLEILPVEVGEKLYLSGQTTGIAPEAWDMIRRSKGFLKGPITTPQGGGFKSLNVTIRTTLGLYANVRPCVSFYPFVATKHPKMDVVIIRENEEDLYTGIEYRQSKDTYHALKIISRPGCERIVRYAFEYAVANHRKKVTCFTKDNILKMTDGLFHKVFEEISKEYPTIENEHWIVDIGAAKLADTPEVFDVIVMPNLYGDILSDVAAQIAGSVGLAGSANIGAHCAMFEAIHGSAPRRAGQNMANPSGLIQAAVLMLVHIGLSKEANMIQNAWLKTLEDGIHTYDIFKPEISKQRVGTREFGQAIVDRLGQKPSQFKPATFDAPKHVGHVHAHSTQAKTHKEIVGVDIFIDWEQSLDELYSKLKPIINEDHETLKLSAIFNRGVQVWPTQAPETLCIDSWRCRYTTTKGSHAEVITLLESISNASLDFTHIEMLYDFS